MQNPAKSQQHGLQFVVVTYPQDWNSIPLKIGPVGIDPFPNVPFSLLDQKESISLRDIYHQ